jgi:hypothetical protein
VRLSTERAAPKRLAGREREHVTIYLAFTAAACLFVVLWALGLNADVAGLIALAVLGLPIVARMAPTPGSSRR